MTFLFLIDISYRRQKLSFQDKDYLSSFDILRQKICRDQTILNGHNEVYNLASYLTAERRIV